MPMAIGRSWRAVARWARKAQRARKARQACKERRVFKAPSVPKVQRVRKAQWVRKERLVFISERAREWMQAYFGRRGDENPAAFVGYKGKGAGESPSPKVEANATRLTQSLPRSFRCVTVEMAGSCFDRLRTCSSIHSRRDTRSGLWRE